MQLTARNTVDKYYIVCKTNEYEIEITKWALVLTSTVSSSTTRRTGFGPPRGREAVLRAGSGTGECGVDQGGTG